MSVPLALLLAASAGPAVGEMDFARYSGTWYEIAAIPKWFQRGCTATTVTYSDDGQGGLAVVNRCRRGRTDGPPTEARGRVRRRDPARPGVLEISFFGPFWSDFHVFAIGPEYAWAVVGAPDGRSLWLLARSPQVDAATLREMTDRAAAAGFDTVRLVPTLQP